MKTKQEMMPETDSYEKKIIEISYLLKYIAKENKEGLDKKRLQQDFLSVLFLPLN